MTDAAATAMSYVSRGWARFYGRAWLLLGIAMLMWGGNAVASRLAVGQISPMALVALRWLIVCSALTMLLRKRLPAEWRVVRPRWALLPFLAIAGFTGFNALFYTAGHLTSGVNIAIIQGAVPIFVLIGNRLVYGVRTTLMQAAGLALTIAGIIVVGTQGHPLALFDISWNMGDLMMLIAAASYAGYTLGLRHRPKVSALGFFTMVAYVAFLTSLPLVAFEIVQGKVQWPTPQGVIILLYVAFCPSFLGQILYMRGVQLIGPARAGLFFNLLPVFGALLSVLLIGEPFGLYHAVALALVLGGIGVAEHIGRPAADPS